MKFYDYSKIKGINWGIKGGLFLSILSFLILGFSNNIADPDLWGYLSFGRLFWHSSKFPYQDVFSYLPTLNPWVYHEWLTGVLFYPLYKTSGGPGLQIFKYTMGLTTMALIYLTAKKRGANTLSAAFAVVIILSVVRLGYSPVRAQIFTLFFFALYLYLLERARLTGRWQVLFLLPVIQVVWCNLHGGFLAGLGLIAIYAVGEFFSRRSFLPYILVFMVSIIITFINPYGLDYWEYLGRAVTMPRPFITEWYSIYKSYQSGVSNLWMLIFLLTLSFIIIIGICQLPKWEFTSTIALTVTLVLGLWHVRHLLFFLILVGAYLPVCFCKNFEFIQSFSWVRKIRRLTSLKMAFLMFLSLIILINLSFIIKINPLSLNTPKTRSHQRLGIDFLPYPVDAVGFIKEQGFSGNILTHFGWGEYLIWELYPQCLVAFDGRYETVFPPEVEKAFFKFIYGLPQWRQFLEEYPPDLILLKKQNKVAKLLQNEPHWRNVYSDSTSVLFVACKKESNDSMEIKSHH